MDITAGVDRAEILSKWERTIWCAAGLSGPSAHVNTHGRLFRPSPLPYYFGLCAGHAGTAFCTRPVSRGRFSTRHDDTKSERSQAAQDHGADDGYGQSRLKFENWFTAAQVLPCDKNARLNFGGKLVAEKDIGSTVQYYYNAAGGESGAPPKVSKIENDGRVLQRFFTVL